MPDEEVHWLAAAEWADYLGVDVINTSLGYNNYDDSRYDYETSDLDGQTSYISRAAQIASDKGIMVVVSAGNSRSEEHTSELQSRGHLVCRLLLEKKKNKTNKQSNNKQQK